MGWQEHQLYADDQGLRVGDRDAPFRAFSWDSVTRLLAAHISAHLPGIRRDWQTAVAAAPNSAPVTIWER